VKNGDGGGLRCCMRLDYNMSHGIWLFIRKQGGEWTIHSHPFPGELPSAELKKFIALFKRSVQYFNPRAKFKRALVST